MLTHRTTTTFVHNHRQAQPSFTCDNNSMGTTTIPAAFVVTTTTAASSSSLWMSCRTNAKKEKIKRNRDNMRKFKKSTGRRGLSRRKLMKKALASKARQEEAEFISKCYITIPAAGAEEEATLSKKK